MKVVMTGGGSGGHITPILAVARKLKQTDPGIEIAYIGQTGDGLADLVESDTNIDRVYQVPAGKLRRYSGEGWRQLLDFHTQLLNLRDITRVIRGTWRSYRLLGSLKPDVIFTRGGFVSVPVAVGGRLRHIPYITHDSDSVPSLANRLIARWAAVHAVALPVELYPYPPNRTVVTGIPINHEYRPVDNDLQRQYRAELHLSEYEQIILVTGGGNGARALNRAVVASAADLLKRYPSLAIIHLTGRALETETVEAYDALSLEGDRKRIEIIGFTKDLHRLSGAADIVIARGGATNLAEFAVQHAACIIVPSKQLGWNIKNSQAMADRGAVRELTEDEAAQDGRLVAVVSELLDDKQQMAALRQAIGQFAQPHAADNLAELIIKTGRRGSDVRS